MAAPLITQARRETSEAMVFEEQGDLEKAAEKYFLVSQIYLSAAPLSSHGSRTLESLAEMHHRRALTLTQALNNRNSSQPHSYSRSSQNNTNENQSINYDYSYEKSQMRAQDSSNLFKPPAEQDLDYSGLSVPLFLDDKKYEGMSSIILSQLNREEEEKQERETRELERERGKVEKEQGRIQVGPTDSIIFDEHNEGITKIIEEDYDCEEEDLSFQTSNVLRKLLGLLPSIDFNSSQSKPNLETNIQPNTSPTQDSDLLKSFHIVSNQAPTDLLSPSGSLPKTVSSDSSTSKPSSPLGPTITPSSFSSSFVSTIPSSLLYLPSSVVSNVKSTFQSFYYQSSNPTSSSNPKPEPLPSISVSTAPTQGNKQHSTLDMDDLNQRDDETIQKLYSSVLSLAEKNASLSQKVAESQQVADENEALKKSIIKFRKEAGTLLQTQQQKVQKKSGQRLTNSAFLAKPQPFQPQPTKMNTISTSQSCQCHLNPTNCCCSEQIRNYKSRIEDLERQLKESRLEADRLRVLCRKEGPF